MSTLKNAKKRRQQQSAQQRRQGGGAPSTGKGGNALPPASDDVIESTEPAPLVPVADPLDERDGPGFTAAKGGAANWVLIVVMVAIVATALIVVFR